MKVKVKLPEFEQRSTGLFDAEAGVQLGRPELRETKAFPVIDGYAAVFNSLSEPLFAGVREKIRPGAFAKSLAEGDDVRALVDHKPSAILGRNKAGTLRLREDSHGLHYEIDPPDTTLGRDTITSLRRRDIDQSSFGFQVVEEEYNIKEDVVTRELIEVKLFDVSIVTYPAYPQTSVSVRSLWPNLDESTAKSQMEAWFRDIKNALAPPRVLPQYERRLRLRKLELLGKKIGEQEETRTAKKVQSVIFMRSSWTAERAKTWLANHDFVSDKMDTTETSYRFRQFDPGGCKEGSYETLTQDMPRGVRMVVCEKV